MNAPQQMPPGPPQRTAVLLVVAQFALIGVLAAVALPAVVAGTVPVTAWGLFATGLATFVGAIAHNRPGNFNIRPTPHPRGRLVESGPYRWVRHPMYSGVLLCALACVLARPGWPSIVAAVALALVLDRKARVEEGAMTASHPAYAAYRQRTRRFVPGVY